MRKGVKVCAVLKANAYSLGDVAIAKYLERYVECFGVANIIEAKRLRMAGIKLPIQLFGVCNDFKQAHELNLVVSINSVNEIKELAKHRLLSPIRCHIKINTGMNRFGITTLWQLRKIIEVAATNTMVKIDGIYTHMAHEEDSPHHIDEQLRKFVPFRALFKRHFPNGIVHAACSGSAHYPPTQFDMVRVGKLMYGGYHGYKTAVKATAKIVAMQNVRKCESVGYNGDFVAQKPTRVGVVACGYADVSHYGFSNKGFVIVDKKKCRILGRVCMDTLMIDISEIDNPLGKNVTLMGEYDDLRIMDLCKTNGVIACDFLCGLGFARSNVIYTK
jgi:alanine racemase